MDIFFLSVDIKSRSRKVPKQHFKYIHHLVPNSQSAGIQMESGMITRHETRQTSHGTMDFGGRGVMLTSNPTVTWTLGPYWERGDVMLTSNPTVPWTLGPYRE